ncbi:plastid lipid-associated protein/fibrillin conserved domain-containing protein [Pseudoscourfieldia marina]
MIMMKLSGRPSSMNSMLACNARVPLCSVSSSHAGHAHSPFVCGGGGVVWCGGGVPLRIRRRLQVHASEGSSSSSSSSIKVNDEDSWVSDESTIIQEVDVVQELESALLVACLHAGRGDDQSYRTNENVAAVNDAVEKLANVKTTNSSKTGTWRLAYASTPLVFRATPFYWLVGEMATNIFNVDAERDLFPLIGSLQEPLQANFGDIVQEVDGDLLRSRVQLSVLSGALSTTLVTTARTVPLTTTTSQAQVVVESSRVTQTPLSPILDAVDVPVESIFDAIGAASGKGASALKPVMRTIYTGEQVRVEEVQGVTMVFERQ